MSVTAVSKYSILFPDYKESDYKTLSPEVCHDMGLDFLCKKLSANDEEQRLIIRTMSLMTDRADIAAYRADVFEDIYTHKKMRDEILETLDKIKFLQDFGGISKQIDEISGIWELLHRLDEMNDYIKCVETLSHALSDKNLKSEGLKRLKDGIDKIYNDNAFDGLKKDVQKLNATTRDLKSVTLGVNLNSRFEAESIGLISINKKEFSKSNILKNFYEKLSFGDTVKDDTEWKENYNFFKATPTEHKDMGKGMAMMHNPLLTTLASVPDSDGTKNIMRNMDIAANNLLNATAKRLQSVLSKYVVVSIRDITDLTVEFLYYIRWAEYIEKLSQKGMVFAKPKLCKEPFSMKAKDFYNLKLAAALDNMDEIVVNDLDFDESKRVYILTGANRGGKTTVTQAVGLLFILAQGGIYTPSGEFEYSPVDCIYTHFPIDEDKTMDLGRLGEECKRFKELYSMCTGKSLLLLNETFSTTSFEEGYYIACDGIRAILKKGIRTIYNTHMHKIAYDTDKLNENANNGKAYSLVVCTDNSKRSFKIKVAPPEGVSYAKDIAEKYGVTYEMLTE